MKKLIEDNYESTVLRGLITPDTNHNDFIEKLREEVLEADQAESMYELSFELADIVLTAINYARHYEINIEKFLKDKIHINYARAKTIK